MVMHILSSGDTNTAAVDSLNIYLIALYPFLLNCFLLYLQNKQTTTENPQNKSYSQLCRKQSRKNNLYFKSLGVASYLLVNFILC